MGDYSEEDARSAGKMVEALLHDDEALGLDFGEGFSILDIQGDADEFRADIELLSDIGEQVPSMRVLEGPPIPVSLKVLASGGVGPLTSPPSHGSHYWFYPASRSRYAFDKLELISREEARLNFMVRATDFLATRLAAVNRWRRGEQKGFAPKYLLNIAQFAGAPRSGIPGCNFSVSSNTPNLSVFWSGAYFITSNYFGHPTSPATAMLQSGTYVFGVNGGAYGQTVQWDSSAVCSLPGTPSVHLQF